jgi:signal transduction histidine kinase/DNA-binding response OmpR family regulator/HPt (histidine-containing phosphotransfer) domain-containing protein
MSIRLKIICINSSIALAITLASFGASSFFTQQRLLETVEKDLTVMSDIADRLVAAKIALLKADAGIIAQHLSIVSNEDAIRDVLQAEAKRFREFIGLTVFDEERRIAFYGESPTLESRLKETYLQRALEGQSVISTTRMDPNGKLVVHICVPVDGRRALSAAVSGFIFADMLENLTLWTTGSIFVLDENGTILVSKNRKLVQERVNFFTFAKETRGKKASGSLFARMRGEENGVGFFRVGSADESFDQTERICAFQRVSDSSPPWTLGVQAPLRESPAAGVKEGLLLAAGLLLALGFGLAVASANGLIRPFQLIEEQNRRLTELNEVAHNALEGKSRFLANMSHEMRTPMNAIIGLSELMLSFGELPQSARDNLGKVYSAGVTLLHIINDLLDLSKIESGHFEIIPVDYDTPSLINDTITTNMIRIGEKPVTFVLDVDAGFPGRLRGDDLRLKQICNNLLSNAFKYTSSGTVTWRLACERQGEDMWLSLVVEDTGIGIRQEDIAKLFSEYSQVDTRNNRKVEGTGLGLALTKRLVDLMDGTIGVSSEYGRGTVFTVRLRQKFVSDVPIGEKVANSLKSFVFADNKRDQYARITRLPLPYARVLLVDDVQTNLDVARGMLKPYGMQIDCVTGGAAAVALIREEKTRYDAIFMDHMMPDLDGIEATRIIRDDIGTEYARTVPIIALTANAIVGNEEMFLRSGFQAFLTKPIDMQRLDAVLRQWVRNREREKEWNEASAQKQGADAAEHPAPGETEKPESGKNGEERAAAVPASAREWDIEEIDLERCLSRFGGDRTILLDVFASYAEHTPPLLERLRVAAGENLPDYAIAVHGIKGASRGICADALGDEAERLEQAAKAGEDAFVAAHGGSFIGNVESLVGKLLVLLRQERGARPDRPKKEAPDAAVLNSLRLACANYDMDGVDAAMDALESSDYESGGDLVLWLRSRVNTMDFQEICERLGAAPEAS